MRGSVRAGRIVGNPLCGLDERVCIEAKKIYDGCIERVINQRFDGLRLTDFSALDYALPLNFIRTYNGQKAEVVALSVTGENSERVNIRCSAILPMVVEAVDANGEPVTIRTELPFQRQVRLRVPPSPQEYSVEVSASARGGTGIIDLQNYTLSFTGCLAVIVRIVTPVDIVIPSYGQCVYPECNDGNSSCQGLFSVPPFN